MRFAFYEIKGAPRGALFLFFTALFSCLISDFYEQYIDFNKDEKILLQVSFNDLQDRIRVIACLEKHPEPQDIQNSDASL